LTPAERQRANLIFDARKAPQDLPARFRVGGLSIEFAGCGGDADAAICDWLESHTSPKQVRLISSDRQLQRAARVHGAQFTRSEVWFKELERRRDRGPEAQVSSARLPGRPLTSEELHFWTRYFGEIDLDDIARESALPQEIQGGRQAGTKPSPVAESSTPGKSVGRRVRGRRPTIDLHDPEQIRNEPLSASELAGWLEEFSSCEAMKPGPARPGVPPVQSAAEIEAWLKDQR
jgi:hypothetical protein